MEYFENGQYFKVFNPVIEGDNFVTLDIGQQETLTEIFQTLQMVPNMRIATTKPKLELIIGGKK